MWVCRGCNEPIRDGDLRRGDDWHAKCWNEQFRKYENHPERKKQSRRRREPDDKAPDGFLLGGLRKVRKDGTVLFHRSYWKVPDEWIGEHIWIRVMDGWAIKVEAAPPGQRITQYAYGTLEWLRAPAEKKNIKLERADKPDAKPGYRSADNKAWAARSKS